MVLMKYWPFRLWLFLTGKGPSCSRLLPTVFYPVYCRLLNIEYRQVPLQDDFTLNVEEFYRENHGIIFPNPNAPTGIYLPLSKVEKIVAYNIDKVVIIDEAYIDFGGKSAVSLIDKYPNLLIVQTFSKSRSLAGLRIGFAMGNKKLIEGLNRVKNSINSYTLDTLAMIAAREAIKDDKYFEETRLKIIKTRDRVAKKFKKNRI